MGMEQVIETVVVDENTTIKIYPDYDAISPRDADNFGVIYHWCDYILDEHDEVKLPKDADEINETLEPLKTGIVLPLYLFDHSGISISTSSAMFRACDNAGWDWGQVGFVAVSKEEIIKEYGDDSSESREKAESLMRSEIEELDNFLRGGYVRYVTETQKPPCPCCGHVEIEYDSCGSFDSVETAVEEAKGVLAYQHNNEKNSG